MVFYKRVKISKKRSSKPEIYKIWSIDLASTLIICYIDLKDFKSLAIRKTLNDLKTLSELKLEPEPETLTKTISINDKITTSPSI